MVANFGHFGNVVIFRILGVFSSRFFAQNDSNVLLELFFVCFRPFLFLTQNDDFAKAIAFAWWPILAILEMLSFFEY